MMELDTRRQRMSRIARFVFALLIVFNFASVAYAVQDSEKATLQWKLAKGDALTVQFEQTQNVLTRIDVRDRRLESELVLVVDWNVTGVAGGDATIEQTIKQIRIKTGTPGDEIKKLVDLDTSSETKLRGISRDLMKQVKPLVGLKFVVVISPSGQVVKMTPDKNVAAVVAALPATSALRRVFSASGMAKLIGDSAFALPEKAVGKGDSWSDDSTIPMTANDGSILSFDRKVNSTLTSVDAEKANIDVEMTLSQPKPATPAATALTSPLQLLSCSGGGNVVFDRSTGTVTSSSMNSEMKTRVIYRTDQVKTTTSVTNKVTVTRK